MTLTKEQIVVNNLIVQFVAETPIYGDDKSRLEYELIGSGSGLVFVNGKVIKNPIWKKRFEIPPTCPKTSCNFL